MAANLAVERPKKSRNEEVMQSPREATRSGASYFYISENVDSLNYTPITNLLEFERQKTQTYGSLTLEDCLRLMMFVITGLLSAFIGVFLEISIEKIGHWKFQVINEFVREQFEEDSYNLVTIAAVRFAGVAVPVMLGTALVVYLAPYASGGGVSQCIAYLNGIRVPKVLNLRGIIVRAISTVCTCVSGLAGGKEGPAIFLGTASGGSLPSLFPWLNLRSDVERRDLAAAGFGSGIAVVFGAPIGGLLLALEEGLSYWEIGLMWKMYLCCVVAYAVGSIVFSLFLGVEVKLNNQDLTAFGEISSSITRVHKRFREVSPDVVPKTMTGDEAHTVRVPREQMEKLPELRENPFRTRILEVFSRDGKGNLTFEDFLDLLSVFSEQAPRDIKVFYAFKIYDFDNDQHVGPADIETALRLLTHGELSPEEVSQVVEKAVEEADVDGDGKLSYMEFEHVILRAPDFLSTFHIRL